MTNEISPKRGLVLLTWPIFVCTTVELEKIINTTRWAAIHNVASGSVKLGRIMKNSRKYLPFGHKKSQENCPVDPEIPFLMLKKRRTRNAWQSLAYCPLGTVVSPPCKYLRKTLTYWSPECLTAPAHREHRWTNRGNNYRLLPYNLFRLKLWDH